MRRFPPPTTRLGLSGLEVILRLWVPGDVLGPTDLLAGGRHSSTAQAFRLTRALVWDASSFKALADRYPVLDQNLLRMVVRYLADLEERFREMATERVVPRGLVSWCDSCRRSAGRPMGPSK
jgi:CRP-like cAMP-binding protein